MHQFKDTKQFPEENNWIDLTGFLMRSETIPTHVARTVREQIVLVTNAGSTRTYFYEPVAATWLYTQLT